MPPHVTSVPPASRAVVLGPSPIRRGVPGECPRPPPPSNHAHEFPQSAENSSLDGIIILITYLPSAFAISTRCTLCAQDGDLVFTNSADLTAIYWHSNTANQVGKVTPYTLSVTVRVRLGLHCEIRVPAATQAAEQVQWPCSLRRMAQFVDEGYELPAPYPI